jgi:hypothetical protein
MVPRGIRVGRNVKIAGDLRTGDFTGRVIRSGMSVERTPARRRKAAVEGGVPALSAAEAAGKAGG